MTTPKSTANHSLDHPEDATVREVLRAQLIGARKAVGADMALLGLAIGRYDQWLYRTEVHSRSQFWKFNTVYDWGRAVGMNVFVHPRLNPVLPEHLIGPLARAGVSNPAFSAVGFLEYVQAWASFKGIEQRHIAAALDVNHGTMYAINESDNPRILTLQKYVRALGGRLEFHVEPIGGWQFRPVPPPF